MVETNAVFERDAIRPMAAGSLPETIKELIMPHLENHEYTMEAALNCDEGLVVKAFMNDPLLRGKGCGEKDVRDLARDMIHNTIGYLPEAWRK